MDFDYLLIMSLVANAICCLGLASQQIELRKLRDSDDDEAPADVNSLRAKAERVLEEKQIAAPTSKAPPTVEHTLRKVSDPKHGMLTGRVALLVDDTPLNLEVLTEFLEILGLDSYYIATNGQEAVDIAKNHRVDIAYMDIQMPKMNGIDATKRIRMTRRGQGIAIVGVTAFSRIVSEDMCKEAGMVGFMQKPVELDVLEQQTRIALRALSRMRAA